MGITIPKLEDYDINVLIALGNQMTDVFHRNHIKIVIIKKLLKFDYPLFFLINKFISSEKILRESYAEVIVMRLRDTEYYIDDEVVKEIIELTSLDTLMYYGMESCSLSFCDKCKDEFWKRAMEIENKMELRKKMNIGNIESRKKVRNRRKGD